jgi:hypothetical protein
MSHLQTLKSYNDGIQDLLIILKALRVSIRKIRTELKTQNLISVIKCINQFNSYI